jgi:hypothetical protein
MNCNANNTICVIPANEYDAAIAGGWQLVLAVLIVGAVISIGLAIYFNTRSDWLAQKNRQAEIRNQAKEKKVAE